MIKDPLAATAGRREATIIARVQEMQQLGIWNSKKIPKINMPARPKTHWDYVIEEMNWLSSVILQERKTKKVNIFFDNFLLFFLISKYHSLQRRGGTLLTRQAGPGRTR